MRIPSYDDLTPSIPDIAPGEVFEAVARLLPTPLASPAANSQLPNPNSQNHIKKFGSWELGFGNLFACLRSARMPDVIERIARDFSPRLQRYGADAVVLDVSGLGHLIGNPHAIGAELARACLESDPRTAASTGNDPRPSAFRIALAPTQTAALLLTLADDAPLIVVTADESTALAPLPLQCLQQHIAAVQGTTVFRRDRAKAIETDFAVLRRWGLKTLGELAALPPPDLSARMGQAGLALQQLARGSDPGPLVPDPGVPRFIERIELEWPIDALEPLSFVLARLLDPLSSALERAGRAAAAIRLHLRLVDRTTHERVLQLPAAMRDPRVLRTLLLLDLESHAPPAAVDVVTVEADPAPGRVMQYSLLERALPSTETIATLIARLGALVGESRCGSPHIPDTHRPDAFEIQQFNPSSRATSARVPELPSSRVPCIRRFRPPVAVRVTVNRGRPVHLAIDRRGMPGGSVVQAAGPWRSSGAWWEMERPRPTRPFDELRVALSSVEGRGAGLPAEALPASWPTFAKATVGTLRTESSAKAGRKPGEHEEMSAPWDRDEWEAELADGSVCRLFHDRRSDVWFLDGIFD